MKALLLNYEFPPLGGGGGVASKELAKGFIKLGYKVDFVTSGYKGQKKEEMVDGIKVYRTKTYGRTNIHTANVLAMGSFILSGFYKSLKLCLKNNYSFLNTHFVLPTGPLGFALSKIFGIKNIISLHGGDIYDPTKKMSPHNHKFLKRINRFLLENATNIVAQSKSTKNNTIKHYSPQKHINVIPLPYEIKNFERLPREKLGLDPNKKYIISMGRFVKRKGFEYIIKAMPFLNKNIECLLVGDGPERKNLTELSYKLKIQDRVKFLGFLHGVKKYQYLAASDIFILSSIYEPFGIVLQDAMQCAVPIISTKDGGQQDLITENKNGLFIKPKNIMEIVEKTEELLSNHTLLKEMSLNNKLKIKKYNYIDIAQEYLSIIK